MSEFHMFENSGVESDSLDFRIVLGSNISSGESKSIESAIDSIIECRTSTYCEARVKSRSGGYGLHVEWNGLSIGRGRGYGGSDITRILFGDLYITGAYSAQGQGQVNIMWRAIDSRSIGFAIGPSFRKQNYEILFNHSAGERRSRFIPSEHLVSSTGLRMISAVNVDEGSMPFVLRSSFFVGRLEFSNHFFASFGLNIAFD